MLHVFHPVVPEQDVASLNCSLFLQFSQLGFLLHFSPPNRIPAVQKPSQTNNRLGNLPATPKQGAFSLVEIVIAIGVFSFCIVTIVYLMGVALSASRESQRDTAMTSIVKTMEVELRSFRRDKLVNATNGNDTTWYASNTLYFDLAGNKTASTNAPFKANVERVPAAKISDLLGTSSNKSFLVWVLTVRYPAPVFNEQKQFVFGRAFYGPEMSNLYE